MPTYIPLTEPYKIHYHVKLWANVREFHNACQMVTFSHIIFGLGDSRVWSGGD